MQFVATMPLVDDQYNLLENASSLSVSSHLTNLQSRITELCDYRVYGASHANDLLHLYSNRYEENHLEIMRCGHFDHTMFESIDTYCSQKFPVDEIKQGLLNNWGFEVHGIFPDHFAEVSLSLGYEILKEIDFNHNKREKKFNFVRPKFFICKNATGNTVIVIAVNSGRDYVFHYASMLKHVVTLFSIQKADQIKVVRYPLAESSIHVWTQLNNKLVKRGDIVVIGYVEEVDKFFKKHSKFVLEDLIETKHYSSIRYKNPKTGSAVNLIGVKYSFWGCISAKITTQLCRLGASEIIYVGKLGTLSAPEDIYQRIFVPAKYLIMYHDKLVCTVDDLHNKFLAENPHMSTDMHVSVPTVVEEDYVQRDITTKLKINSIDNEISQMAYSVAKYNKELGEEVSFTSLHFATDYIRRPEERSLEVEFDLSNNRSKKAFESKIKILDQISKLLVKYLSKR